MMNVFRRFCLFGALLPITSFASAASAQEPVTALDRQLSRVDLAISGTGEFTSKTNGTNLQSQSLNLDPSNTLGALVTLRYTKSPLVGLEFNYGYARYTENFTYGNVTPRGVTQTVLGVQTNASEYTLGYVVHTPRYFGVQPYASAGAGTIAFKPTTGGGQGFLEQGRAAYYYNLGVEDSFINEHFGLRAGFRQVFFLAPDYETNYLTNKQRSITSEPIFGFYLRF